MRASSCAAGIYTADSHICIAGGANASLPALLQPCACCACLPGLSVLPRFDCSQCASWQPPPHSQQATNPHAAIHAGVMRATGGNFTLYYEAGQTSYRGMPLDKP